MQKDADGLELLVAEDVVAKLGGVEEFLDHGLGAVLEGDGHLVVVVAEGDVGRGAAHAGFDDDRPGDMAFGEEVVGVGEGDGGVGDGDVVFLGVEVGFVFVGGDLDGFGWRDDDGDAGVGEALAVVGEDEQFGVDEGNDHVDLVFAAKIEKLIDVVGGGDLGESDGPVTVMEG